MNNSKNIHFVLSVLLVVLIEKSHELKFLSSDRVIITKDCRKNLEIYQPNVNGQWPSKVFYAKYGIRWKQSQAMLFISWNADIKNVKGFKIVLKPSGKPDICRILNYTGLFTDSSSGRKDFYFKLNSIYKFTNFTAELFPLPKRDSTTILFSKFDTVDCSHFSPIFTQDYDGRILNITFSTGPKSCNYKKYEISVFNSKNKNISTQILPTQENVDKLQTYFKLNICKGKYFIMASVYKDTPCVCQSKEKKCEGCTHTMSKLMYLVPEKSCSPKNLLRQKVEANKNIFPLTIVMGLLLLTALALFITHWKLSSHLMVKKQGIVLFLDDHEHHTNAVMKLVNYLNESHLKVFLASTFVKNRDLVDISDQLALFVEVLKSDFVLLVLSSALQKRMAAWSKNQDYVDFFKEKNSNILSKTVLETLQRSNKLYVCKFDHVAEFGNWPKPCYSLPSNLTNMVADLNGQSYSQRLVLCNCFKSKALWDEFQTAFKKTCTYEQSHANWFQEKYLCPRNVAVYHFLTDEMSQDSLKLKELFIDNKNNYPDPTEERITDPSVFSEPISEKLEAVNNRNL